MSTKTREALEARAQEIRYLGTQFAMNGVDAPPELAAEYDRIQAELRRLDATAPAGAPPSRCADAPDR